MNNKAFEIAKEWYDAHGVDVNAAMDAAAKTAISMHCWAGRRRRRPGRRGRRRVRRHRHNGQLPWPRAQRR